MKWRNRRIIKYRDLGIRDEKTGMWWMALVDQ